MWLRLICLVSLGLAYACTDENCVLCDNSGESELCLACSSPLFPSGSICEACSSTVLTCQITESGFWQCECPPTGQVSTFDSSPGDYSHCTFPGPCQICMEGFYHSDDNTCLQCHSKCKTCQDSQFCTSCSDPFSLSNNFFCCDSTCSICNHDSCFVCNEGFSLKSGSCVPVMSDKCNENCIDCNEELQCTSCTVGYFLTEGNYCEACGPFMRPGCPTILSQCSNGCSECSIDKCLRCADGYFLDKNNCKTCNPRCTICMDGGICVKCSQGYELKNGFCCEPGCKSCSYEKCWMCDNGLLLSNYQCQSCPADCVACSNGVCKIKPCPGNCIECDNNGDCLRCNSGFYVIAGRCAPCHPNCRTCIGPNTCITCPSNRNLYGSNCCESNCDICDFNKCWACALPYVVTSDNKCVVPGCPYNCLSCNSGICSQCEIGFYISTDGTCKACDSNCETCSSDKTCDTCFSPYHLVQHACCEENCISCDLKQCLVCSEGKLLKNGKCYDCLSSGCLFCQSGDCITNTGCTKGCVLCSSSKCISCGPGYYLDDSGNCKECSSRCSSCTSLTVCGNCNTPYVLKNSFCCPSSCSACDSSKCSGCIDGYILDSNGSCLGCPSTCSSCIGGVCQPKITCPKNCQSCSSSSACTTCNMGYTVDASGECVKK